ncbi:MAG: ZIP family metal transporter [Candidatus Micrarchaeia archaeon]
MLWLIIIATVLISLLSLSGVLLLGMKKDLMRKALIFLIAFAVGAMMGGALLHLMPEAIEEIDVMAAFILLFIGFMLFFVIEKFLHWRHCHEGDCKIHGGSITGKKGKIKPAAYLNLIGDSVHNFIDGVIIAVSFVTSIEVGIASAIAIALHEIPQEFGDFAVLVHSGIKPKKALIYNLFTAFTAVVGGIAGYFFLTAVTSATPYLLTIAAGGFLYIAAADLVPELHNEIRPHTSAIQFIAILLGFVLMYLMKSILGG